MGCWKRAPRQRADQSSSCSGDVGIALFYGYVPTPGLRALQTEPRYTFLKHVEFQHVFARHAGRVDGIDQVRFLGGGKIRRQHGSTSTRCDCLSAAVEPLAAKRYL